MSKKKPDEIVFTDQPGLPAISGPSNDLRAQPWYQFSQAIDDLLATGQYTWAEETLTGIQESVEKMQVVTEGQRKAVANIEAARASWRPGRYPRSRRYS
jgi:hypothetical protein